MHVLQGNCAIELKLDECLSRAARTIAQAASSGKLSAQQHNAAMPGAVQTQQQRGHSSRIPSWMHLPSLPGFVTATIVADTGPTPAAAIPEAAASSPAAAAAGTGPLHDAPAAALAPAQAHAQPHAHMRTHAAGGGHRSDSAPPGTGGARRGSDSAALPTPHGDPRAVASAPSSPNGLAITSASSSSAEAEGELDGASPEESAAGGDYVLRTHRRHRRGSGGSAYGASPEGKSWAGLLRPMAHALEAASEIGSRQRSSYALDVMAP